MADQLTITFDDGHAENVAVKVRAVIAAERHLGNDPPAIEASLFAAWWTLHPGADPAGFEPWLDTIDKIDRVNTTAVSPPDGG